MAAGGGGMKTGTGGGDGLGKRLLMEVGKSEETLSSVRYRFPIHPPSLSSPSSFEPFENEEQRESV